MEKAPVYCVVTGALVPQKPKGSTKTHIDRRARRLKECLVRVEILIYELSSSTKEDPPAPRGVTWSEEAIKDMRGRFYRMANHLNRAERIGGKRPAQRMPKGEFLRLQVQKAEEKLVEARARLEKHEGVV